MLRHRGLQLSLLGGLIFAISMIALTFVADTVPLIGVLLGGLFVWSGFIWTMYSFYQGVPRQPPDKEA